MITKSELNSRLIARQKVINNYADGYQQYLDTMKSFFGKDFPMIVKFEEVLNKFKRESTNQLKELSTYCNNLIVELYGV